MHDVRLDQGELDELIARLRAAGDIGHHIEAASLATAAIELLDRGRDDPATRAVVLMNLAANLAQLGRVDEALGYLDQAATLDSAQTCAVASAKGLMLYFARRYAESAAALDLAVAASDRATPYVACAARIRRGATRIALAELAGAADDLAEAAELAETHHLGVLTFMALHNLGYVRFLQGELPAALADMRAARIAAGDGAPDGVPATDRARVLIAAGLLSEARATLTEAVRSLREHKAGSDLADALLAFAELERLDENKEQALRHARECREVAQEMGFHNLALLADLQTLTAEAGVSTPAASLADRAQALAHDLDENGFAEEAALARLWQAWALNSLGRLDESRTAAETAAAAPHPSLQRRIHQRLTFGRIELASGRPERGLAELAAGLDELASFGARFGSQDMQSGAAVHGQDLARLGLGTAIATNDPELILEWVERSRAVSTRLPTVTPPSDPALAELLGAVRLAVVRERQAAFAGTIDPDARRELTRLRGEVRAQTWNHAGSGRAARPINLGQVQQGLARDGGDATVVAYVSGRTSVRALLITATSAHFVDLGRWQDTAPEHPRRAADLDMLAAPRVPAVLRAVARRSVDAEFDRLDAALLRPLASRMTGGPLVIVAVGELATVPWGLLPTARGRAVAVNSSVTAAFRAIPDLSAAVARPAPDRGPAHASGVLAVAGPEVESGDREVRAVAGIYPGARFLAGATATGEALLAGIPAGGVLHVAAHGRHDAESPMFSHVLLADGPLYAYDIAPNAALPAEVILSSCDVGRTHLRPGGEPLGLAAALLRSGVDTVVAGTSRIADDVAAEAMIAYHTAAATGQPPAAALSMALQGVGDELAPFTCFGAGWLTHDREGPRSVADGTVGRVFPSHSNQMHGFAGKGGK